MFHGDSLELRKRRAVIDRDIRSRRWCDGEIAPQNRRAAALVNFVESNRLVATVVEDGPASASTDIGDPIGALTQHGREIPLALVVRDHHRK